jgi:16S rRNA (uracil1498-N3)-methyltransferase
MAHTSPPRLFVETPLGVQPSFMLPATAARHAQVLRLQPGDLLTLFDGRGGEWRATVVDMGRRDVTVAVQEHAAIERELAHEVTLAVVMPAGDRMDFVVEKATELGAAAILPLMSERSVLRLSGERATKRAAQWQALAVAASEQCGRNRVPQVAAVQTLTAALAGPLAPSPGELRRLLGWRDAVSWAPVPAAVGKLMLLSGPEGGLTPAEEDAARAVGFVTTSLGPRTLRADTAPLAALAAVAVGGWGLPPTVP